MSMDTPGAAIHAGQDHGDATHFTRRGYLTGFGVSALLTIIPFWIVMTGAIENKMAAAAILILLAITQIMVHTFAFLHVNARIQDGWTLVAFVFTAVLVAITIGGSLWIMYHLHLNMMPGMPGGLPDHGM